MCFSSRRSLSTYRRMLREQEEEVERVLVSGLATSIVAGAVIARENRNAKRRERRRKLLRAHLLRNPRVGTPWQALYQSQDDRAFITTMGVDVDTFTYILESGFQQRWDAWTIPREDVDPRGEPRVGRRSLDAAGALGLVLHYLTSSMREVSLQLIFALTPSTCGRYLERGQDILYETLSKMPEAEIRMPRHLHEFERLNDLIRGRHPLLTGAFASIDGLSLAVQESADEEIENATYNGWKSTHCINNVIVFSPEGTILSAILNAPGSWHDARVARSIFRYLRLNVPNGYYLCADSGFPKGDSRVHDKIRAPLKDGQRVPRDPAQLEHILAFNRNLVSYRQTAEWGMRTLQGSFGRLRVPLDINSPEKRVRLLRTCCFLTNLRARRVGISQIRTVYQRIWRESEDERLWDNLGQMMFGEIRRRDRVARFHMVVDDV